MRYENRPQRVAPDLYERCVEAYLRRASRRAVAIYQVGSLSHPGLSDIDLLVVPLRSRFDNELFFSVSNVLPASLRHPFRNDPQVVPPEAVDSLRYTTYGNRKLLAGSDVAAGIAEETGPEQRWSMLFERLSQFEHLQQEKAVRGRVDLAKLVAKTKSIGYSLSDVDGLTGSVLAPSYLADVDALRSGFFDLPDSEVGPRAEELFDRGLGALLSRVAGHLGLPADECVAEFGRDFLLGRSSIPGLCPKTLKSRRSTVERAQRLTRSYGWKKGDLFVRRPYRERLRKLDVENRPKRPLRKMADVAYRIRSGSPLSQAR